MARGRRPCPWPVTFCDQGCVVSKQIPAHLDHRAEFGMWGGMTERERRALLRRRPNVPSWRRLLETARSEHAQTSDLAPITVEAPALPDSPFHTSLPVAS